MDGNERGALRRGWTTGACATAAAAAAAEALVRGGTFPDPVAIRLPGGGTAAFALAEWRFADGEASAGVVKDAGDDPDVTHGALVRARVRGGPPGSGIVFRAGEGVGHVTRAGLPLAPGEPAINPVPRRMIAAAVTDAGLPDAVVTVGVADGERLARGTLNARLGIVGGLSILGTTGIVVPYSCAAWIATIHRGIDVARAAGIERIAASTGSASEAAARALHDLPEVALIEMGDFAGGTLRYLRTHPVPAVTLAGGLAKMSKLAQGRLDLHSKRGALDLEALATLAGLPAIAGANNGADAFAIAAEAGVPLGDRVADAAFAVASPLLAGTGATLEILLFDRDGVLRGRSHDRNRRL